MRINGTFGDGFVHNGWQTVCAAEYAKERVYDAEGTVSKRGIIE
ncbi:hypothetical protein [Paenibacillus sp. J5C2022]|nr:hypothetical protein [Paenibacillus sp. J5C2022]